MSDLLRRLDAPPLFLLGTAGSGANWIYELLTKHPRVAGVRESWIFAGDDRDLRARSEALLNDAVGPGHRFVVEKSAAHVLHIARIAQAWPEARFIHVLRDGREVALRVRRSAHRWSPEWKATFGDSLTSAARAWARSVREAQAARRELGERFLEVRFEGLWSETRLKSVRRIIEFTGIEYDENFVAEALSSDRGRLDRPVPEAWPTNYSVWRAWLFHRAAGDALLSTIYEDDPKWWWHPIKRF